MMINNANKNNANWTGRTPRSMEEAFGPHTRGSFSETVQKGSFFHALVSLAVVIGMIILTVLYATPQV